MKVIKKPLTELRRPDRNVRMHTDKQLKEFRRSVEMFGQIRPIVVDEDGVILAGNGLYETLLSLGRTEADCYVVSGLTEAEKKKLMLADNRVFDLGVDDLAALDAFILDLKDDLDIPGYEEDLLRAMVMEADEASDALLEYGTIEPEQAAAITETRFLSLIHISATSQLRLWIWMRVSDFWRKRSRPARGRSCLLYTSKRLWGCCYAV